MTIKLTSGLSRFDEPPFEAGFQAVFQEELLGPPNDGDDEIGTWHVPVVSEQFPYRLW